MSNQVSMGLLVICVFAVLLTGCHHHLGNQHLVWNGWCGDCADGGACGKGKSGKTSSCIHCGGLLKKAGKYFVCANGCGERYVGEWISDPPDCCDPCDAHYGCFTGAGCCCKKTYDPLLKILRWKNKHCAWYPHQNIPSSGCHYVECPYVYGCHPQLYPLRCGGKKGCGKCGGKGVVGDYVPAEQAEPSPQQSEEFPIPTPTLADQRDTVVASHVESDEQ